MSEISSFRGMAGEVLNGLLRLRTFSTGIFMTLVIALVIVIAGAVMGSMGRVPELLLAFLLYTLPAAFVARFAIASSRGELHSEFFNGSLESGDVLGFVVRYVCITIMWMAPVALLLWLLNMDIPLNPLRAVPSMTSFGGSTFKLLLLSTLAYVLKLCFLLGPMLSIVLATYTSSLEEVMNKDAWAWLLCDRRSDLLPLFAAMIGAPIVFFVVYFIPVSFLCFVVAKVLAAANVNPWSIGGMIASFVSLILFSFCLIACGRLSGAFVLGDDEIVLGAASDDEAEAVTMLASEDPTVAAAAASHLAKNGAGKVDVAEIKARISGLEQEDLSDASKHAKDKLTLAESPLVHHLELILLYQRRELPEKMIEQVNIVLPLCLQARELDEAVAVFNWVSKSRSKIIMESQLWLTLGSALADRAQFLDACWCTYCGASLSNTTGELSVQKTILAIADSAASAGNHQQSHAIYQFFIAKFPESTLLDFAASQKDIEAGKL